MTVRQLRDKLNSLDEEYLDMDMEAYIEKSDGTKYIVDQADFFRLTRKNIYKICGGLYLKADENLDINIDMEEK